jgi:acetylornithine aminotransferase/acetylornithine/N-succinyldiaminopimelate aminotransferase
MHGTTFGGGPLACAVAIAVIDAIQNEGLLAHALEIGGYFQQRLRELQKRHTMIAEVRGIGLMVAAELHSSTLARQVVKRMLERRILINCTSDTVLRFLPPLVVTKADIEEAIQALDAILTEETAEAQLAGGNKDGQ